MGHCVIQQVSHDLLQPFLVSAHRLRKAVVYLEFKCLAHELGSIRIVFDEVLNHAPRVEPALCKTEVVVFNGSQIRIVSDDGVCHGDR